MKGGGGFSFLVMRDCREERPCWKWQRGAGLTGKQVRHFPEEQNLRGCQKNLINQNK